MQTLCKNCGKPIETLPSAPKVAIKLGAIWAHVGTGLWRCEMYAEPLPPKPTRQERAK